jgi:hypothetical protein
VEPYELEEFWDDLLAFIEQGRVIPVVGAELLTVQNNSTTIPLYRAVADGLLGRYGLSASTLADGTVRERHELNDAVCAVAEAARKVRIRVNDLYRPVHDILQKSIAGQALPEALRKLASIRDFDLFATTTPDNLLAQALNEVRFQGTPQTVEIEYAPKLPTERRRDIPAQRSSRYTAVFYIFGKADVSSFYAIHEEDALEFAYTLQAGGGPVGMFSELRNRNLLFIGCTLCDWLSPFFLRSSNSERLFSDHRSKKEFLVGEEAARNRAFVMFLEHFSHDSRCYAIDPSLFVDELLERWSKRNPLSTEGEIATSPTKSGETIFISYSSEDIGAALKLYKGLADFGGDVAWFDKSDLKAGDNWKQSIRSAIERSALFLPLLSASTERRHEAHFREEWTQAVERSRRIYGRKFIVPIVIDPDYSGAMGNYKLVPEEFREIQYSSAPSGVMSDPLKDELKEQLRAIRRARAA